MRGMNIFNTNLSRIHKSVGIKLIIPTVRVSALG